MKRRTFLSLGAASVAVLGTPWFSGCGRNNALHQALAKPQMLAHLCDESGIIEIGKAYVSQAPDESRIEKLTELLQTATSGSITSSKLSEIDLLMIEKSEEDFQKNNTVIVNGWVLSETEARQCALYFLIQ